MQWKVSCLDLRRSSPGERQRHSADRQQGLELRARSTRPRAVVHGLYGADHVPALSENGRRADEEGLLSRSAAESPKGADCPGAVCRDCGRAEALRVYCTRSRITARPWPTPMHSDTAA